MQTHWEKVISESKLISLPEVYLKLQQLLNSPHYSMADIAEVIGYDPAITARLLRMVNSSFFGLAAKIETVTRAINYLGTQQVHDLVLTTSIAQSFSDIDNDAFNLHEYWQRSVFCAIAAREIAMHCNVLDSERLFVTGLLSDIGHLLMYQAIPELTAQARAEAEATQTPLHLVEQRLIGFDYTLAGSAMLQHWNLPESLTDTIKHQFNPGNSTHYQLETVILHMASALADGFEHNIPVATTLQHLNSSVINITNLSVADAEVVDRSSRKSLDMVFQLLFPQLNAAYL